MPDHSRSASEARTCLQQFGPRAVCTAIPLPSLPKAPGATADTIDIRLAAKPAPSHSIWRHHWRDGDDGDITLSFARNGSDYWLRSPGLADFLLQFQPDRILVSPDHATDNPTLEHLLVDQVLPRLLAHRGALMLHASALTIDGHCALFMGPSGHGKSTLAGLLQQAGASVLSDDCVQLLARETRRLAVPTYPSLRLHPDSLDAILPTTHGTSPVASYSRKRRVPVDITADNASGQHVAALYLLGKDGPDAVCITPLSAADTCTALLRHSFRLDLTDRAANAHQFALCGAAARGLPAFRLDYPRDFARSNELVQAVTQHLADLASGSQ